MALLTPAKVRSLLDAHGLHPKRSLGQNFLADANTARRVVALADLPTAASVLEIGPGLGSLTLALLAAGHAVVARELDDRLADVLHAVLADESGASGAGARVRIERGDAVTVDLAAILTPAPSPRACVSNLPYNVAVPVVVRLLEEAAAVERILVMVQREVGERLAAGPGDPQYGAVSVKVAYFAEAHVVGLVPPTVFVPRPKVESALVRLRRREPPVTVPSADGLFALVRAGFAQRRKMLRRSLAPVLGDAAPDVLEAAGVAPTARAEALGLDDWAAVARSAAAAA
jgi:16S rRNA (adenine1518-N6/adenine1519-N6)-dimethyltransferase